MEMEEQLLLHQWWISKQWWFRIRVQVQTPASSDHHSNGGSGSTTGPTDVAVWLC